MKKAIKSILRSAVGSYMIANYLRFAYYTSRKVVILPETGAYTGAEAPVIYATWHGQNFLFPFWFRGKAPTNALVALHGDGRMIGRAIGFLGVKLILGSGGGGNMSGKTRGGKGGAKAFLKLRRVLQAGETVTMTADVPKISRVVGEGIILLARKSGAPIAPIAIVSSRRTLLKNWDRTQIHRPFSRIIYVMGDHITVPDDGTPLKTYSTRLQAAMEAVEARAFALADKRRSD